MFLRKVLNIFCFKLRVQNLKTNFAFIMQWQKSAQNSLKLKKRTTVNNRSNKISISTHFDKASRVGDAGEGGEVKVQVLEAVPPALFPTYWQAVVAGVLLDKLVVPKVLFLCHHRLLLLLLR